VKNQGSAGSVVRRGSPACLSLRLLSLPLPAGGCAGPPVEGMEGAACAAARTERALAGAAASRKHRTR
jgi:hypothetical protein